MCIYIVYLATRKPKQDFQAKKFRRKFDLKAIDLMIEIRTFLRFFPFFMLLWHYATVNGDRSKLRLGPIWIGL